MNYEIIELQEKVLSVTKPVRLSNSDPKISNKIELAWHNFPKNAVKSKIKSQINLFAPIQIAKVMKTEHMMFQ